MPYRVYVIQNREGKFYIGLSDDVGRRIDQHNSGASKCTKTKGPWQLVWQREVLSLSDARKLENRLKRQGRGKGFYSITGLRRSGSSSGSCRIAGLNPAPATNFPLLELDFGNDLLLSIL